MLPIILLTTTLAVLTTAAPLIKRSYGLRCNGESLSSTAEETAYLELMTQGATVDVNGDQSNHVQSWCDAGGCVYISLRSYDGSYHKQTAMAAGEGAKVIYETCGTKWGSGPVIGDGNMVVHLSGNWV